MPNPKLETYKNKATNVVYDYTDADAQSQLTAIKDGTTIDSFGDVETALSTKYDINDESQISILDYDYVPYYADAESATRKIYWTNIKNGLKSFFDDLYCAIGLVPSGASSSNKLVTASDFATAFPRSEQAVMGAINEFNNTATTDTVGGIVCTVDADKTVTASGTYSGGTYVQFTLGRVNAKAGHILKGCPSGGSTSTYQLVLFNSAQTARLATDLGEGAVISADDSNALLAIYFHASVTDKVFKPQICLSMDDPYAPFAMTNRDLTEKSLINKGQYTSVDLNNFTNEGIYILNGSINHAPGNYGMVEVIKLAGGNILQLYFGNGSNDMYLRRYYQNSWTNWWKFTSTEVTP